MGAPNVTITIQTYKEVTVEKGDELVTQRIATKDFNDEDIIIYVITLKNKGSGTAKNVVVKDDVPSEGEYIEGSAVGKKSTIYYSTDNGESFTKRSELNTDTRGKVTNIQWRVEDMPAKSRRVLEFQFRVTAKKSMLKSILAAYLWFISTLTSR